MRQVKFLAAFALALAVAATAVVRAEDRKADKDKDSKFVGKWNVTDMQKDGKRQDDVKDKTVTVTSDKISCHDKDKKCEMECTYTLDTASKPYRITMSCTEGEHKGKKLEGIVEIDGDTAKICFAKPGDKAPASTKETKEGQCCVALRRADSK